MEPVVNNHIFEVITKKLLNGDTLTIEKDPFNGNKITLKDKHNRIIFIDENNVRIDCEYIDNYEIQRFSHNYGDADIISIEKYHMDNNEKRVITTKKDTIITDVYDAHDNLLKSTDNNGYWQIRKYEYDKKYNEYRMVEAKSNNKACNRKCIYASNVKLTLWEDNTFELEEYDDHGNKIHDIYSKYDRKEHEHEYTCKYNERFLPVKETVSYDGILNTIVRYEYDENKSYKYTTNYSENTIYAISEFKFTYDANSGRCIEKVYKYFNNEGEVIKTDIVKYEYTEINEE